MNIEKSVISENINSTVIGEYKKIAEKSKSYQSENELEQELIKTLQGQGYEYLTLKTEGELVMNLRTQLEKLNKYEFTDDEWKNFFDTVISNSNNGILEKTRMIQEDYIQSMILENGTLKNIYLIDKDNIHNNFLQVINQYENTRDRDNRYDVTILVNGLPLVHIELKRRGKDLREAFNQIDRYQRESFWSGSGLFEFVQVFIISNGTQTKYYSNTTRDLHFKSGAKRKKANTYEFTSYWADQNNNAILDLIDFAKTFLSKHSILNILTKYCIFTSEENLLVMRPYQIVATEKIINKINIAHNYKFYGSVKAGGYIWHTTGSGKTLTSFKTSQIAKNLEFIDKVLFVVDRKDLDYQTMKEYDKFQKGAANSNTSTSVLEKQLKDDTKVIITTIQKLANFIKKFPSHDVFEKEVVFIFDECHRSQFGDMHKQIISKFKKYYIFGFTGTPIFAQNGQTKKGIMQTTEQTFGEKLHTYTIVNAIADKNVLPFRYEYVKTIKMKDDIGEEKVPAIDKDSALMNSERISLIVDYVLENYGRKTKNTESYSLNVLENVIEVAKNKNAKEIKERKYVRGFNSLFAVSSIPMAKLYYEMFKRKNHNLKVALIYSYGVNDEIMDSIDDENSESTEHLSQSDRDYLENAIKDYNGMFGTSYDTSSEKFQNYYKDVSLRMKNREIDILIVANMFLTGFDATTLNTLWVDKNLKYHGLIQAFSRTNRILNAVKTFGNVVCFRDLEKNLEEAISLFGDENASSVVLLKTYEEYYNGFDDEETHNMGYKEIVEELKNKFSCGVLITSELEQKKFINLFGSFLKSLNILTVFDKFKGNEILSPREIQDYTSEYNRLCDEWRKREKSEKVDISDDVVFEMELVKQIEVNIDYILALVQKYHESNMEDKEILITIDKAIMASPDLRDKRELIQEFISSLNGQSNVYEDFETFMNSKKKEELDIIISEENLNKELTYDFVRKSFESGSVETGGTEISEILPPISRFGQSNNRSKKKNIVIEKILAFFNKFFNISSNNI